VNHKHNAQTNVGGDHEAAELDDVLQIEPATTLVISASTPYGVNCITRRTSFITQLCRVSMAVRTRWPFSTSSFSSFSAATPRNAAKITTLMIEVGFAPVRSANGFFGTKEHQLRYAQIGHFTDIVALNRVQTRGFRAALNQTFGGQAEQVGHQHADQRQSAW
jgi:hypothetical protein